MKKRTVVFSVLILSLSGATTFAEPATTAVTGSSAVASVETAAFNEMTNPTPDAHSALYEVKPGDNLTVIAKKHGVTPAMIRSVNHLPDDRIRPKQKIKIPNYKFSAVVDKSLNTLVLKGDEVVLKTYVVATGTGNSTPVGVFKITDKLVNPTWYKAGAVIKSGQPENELGSRWLGITAKGYGIHGTVHPETLGRQVTAGCVRMRNEDVEELYSYLVRGSEVTIVD